MRVGQLKQLLEYFDDEVEVLIEAGKERFKCYAFEDNSVVTGKEIIIIKSDEKVKS